ncbi:hypothetical protein [Terricaulis sp.]|uniref:hypothetical protein n=1 Tax=Terricaulis sp. TaxID=2768686 RepID=UPI002AC569E2|nr:hypothetical protein [Terricaulis sp.]MDZ4691095.1 hypothetical protein [Terricaulis sp.]
MGYEALEAKRRKTPKNPQHSFLAERLPLITIGDLRAEAATASSRLKRRPFAAPCYFKRVFIQTAPLSKDGLLTVTPALRKAKAARNSKT